MTEATLGAHVDAALSGVGLVGGRLRATLRREVTAKVLLRRAHDVVLLSGPTGSGKELVAAGIHAAAHRALGRQGDLVEVSCANLAGGLFESELFGHRRGAYTGADRDHAGLVGRAQGGTLVLDEIQALAPLDQARLLRLLGEREYRAVGDHQLQRTDALIVLATNRDLAELVARGEFRRDVLDRATAKITVPSLHERRSDIGELAQSFCLAAAAELGTVEVCTGLTRQARADIETAVLRSAEVSVRRLRQLVRDMVFTAAAAGLPEAIDSTMVADVLGRELGFVEAQRGAQDALEVVQELDGAWSRVLVADLATRHGISPSSLGTWVRALDAVITEMDDRPRTYRNVVERTGRLAKVALWLVSGARSQADFRHYFGELDNEMPTKSVAHQIFYEVFPKDDDA